MVCQFITRRPTYQSAANEIIQTARQFDGGLGPSGTFPAQEASIQAIYRRTIDAQAACAVCDERRRRTLLIEIAALALSTVAGMKLD